MTYRKLYNEVIALLLLMPLVALGTPHTLCDENQKVFFSCKTVTNKFLSVCETPYLRDNSSFLQYRYGTSKKHLDIMFPRTEDEYASRESPVIMRSAQGNISPDSVEIHFNTGKYRYTVFNVASRSTQDNKYHVTHAAVVVVKTHPNYWEEKFVTEIRCVLKSSAFVKVRGWRDE